MNKYYKLQCLKGLLISLDEQLFKCDQTKPDIYQTIVNTYYSEILKFLQENTNENA